MENNSNESNIETKADELELLQQMDRLLSPEEIERNRQERAKELERKGFLPENPELNETMTSPQEIVEKTPRRFIIEECIPACLELWPKNIYTFMVSDHLNEGQCWIEIILDSLSEENKNILKNFTGDDVILSSYHSGCVSFGVTYVGDLGKQKLLELAEQFKMQDVPKGQAWITEEEFLMNYCGCYEEYDNPSYRLMLPQLEVDLEIDELLEYVEKYDQWKLSEESHQKIKKFITNFFYYIFFKK